MEKLGQPKTGLQAARAGVAGAAAVLVLSACGTTEPEAGAGDRPLVLTTFTVLADMVEEVGGEHVDVESLTAVGQEIHGYEPTPEDLRRGADADLVIDNGLHLEDWFEQFLIDVDAPRVTATEAIDPLPIDPEALNAPGGSEAHEVNPHAWMSPAEGQVYVATIAEALAELDPDNAEAYAERAEDYAGELEAVHAEMLAALERIPAPQRVLVTCEGAFSYLARDAGLEEAYLWPVNAEYEGTPQQVQAVVERVRGDDVPAVFCESTVSDSGMRQVVAETGAEYGGTLYVDSLSEEDGPVPTYLDMLRHTAETITEGLGG